MLQDEYNAIGTKIHNLKDQRSDFEEKLKHTSDEDDEIEYKFQIIKINEKIQTLESKQDSLRKQMEEENQKDFLYKKLYVYDDLLDSLCQIYNIRQNSKDNTINYLINNYPMYQIFDVIDLFEQLSFSEKNKFIKTIKTENISIDELLEKYHEEFDKEIILEVERCGFKYDGFCEGEYIFIKDLSNEVEFESYLLDIFEEDIRDYFYCNDIDWDSLSEYEKLMEMPVDYCFDRYWNSLVEEVNDIVDGRFAFDVHIKTPENTIPIYQQTEVYKRRKNSRFNETVERYNQLINEKRQKKSAFPEVDCIKKLTKDSPIEDIADCYRKIEGFKNWKLDKKDSKKIVFERNQGFKKVEIKELKKWVEESKFNVEIEEKHSNM